MNPIDIVQYIVWYATQREIRLTTNRLVKYLYLADLYQARITKGETITGFPWRFVHYGPFCREALNTIEKAVATELICKETHGSSFGDEKEYHLYWCREDKAERIADFFHVGVIGQLQRALNQFGEDTPQLLDYVYFETEPMQSAVKEDLLDFSKAEMPTFSSVVKLKKLSPEAIRNAREKIKKISKEAREDRKKFIQEQCDAERFRDDSYYRFIQFLDGEPLEAGLAGTAKLKF
jgi:hypothetical protein